MKVSDSAVKVSESASRDDTDEPLKEQPIDEIIAQILFEREYDDDWNDSEDEEDSGSRYLIERSFEYLSKTSSAQNEKTCDDCPWKSVKK